MIARSSGCAALTALAVVLFGAPAVGARQQVETEGLGKGKVLASNDDGPNGLDSQIIFTATHKGKYKLVATTLGEKRGGRYRISVKVSAGDGVTASTRGKAFAKEDGIATANDSLSKDEIESDGALKNKAAKFHVIGLGAGDKVQIDLMSKEFDAYLYLTDKHGKVLAKDDDSGEGLNSRIIYTIPDKGNYKLVATSLAGGFGNYTLTVKRLAAAKQAIVYNPSSEGKALQKDEIDEQLRIVTDQLTQKQVEEEAPFRGKAAKYHEVPLREGQTVRIDLMSKDFDSYLIVTDKDGKLLAANDDGGEGLNARLIITAPAKGRYKLIATTFGPGGFGKYRITVQPAKAAKKADD